MLTRRAFVIAALAVGLSALPAPAAGQRLEPISFRLSIQPWGMHLAYYAALEKGYFKEAGLDVKILPGQGAREAVTTVGSGTEDLGIGTVDTVLVAQSKGVPIKVIAMDMYDSPACLMWLEKTPIAKPKDLEGKKVGYHNASSVKSLVNAALELQGVDLSKITFVGLAAGAEYQMVAAGNVDAFGGFCMGQPPTFEQKGFKVKTLSMKDVGQETYGTVIFTNERMMTQRPDALVRFLLAWLRGLAYAHGHVAESTRWALKVRPDRDMLEADKFKIIANMNREAEEPRRSRIFGVMSDARWQKSIDLLVKAGEMQKGLPPGTVYTNLFLQRAAEDARETSRVVLASPPAD